MNTLPTEVRFNEFWQYLDYEDIVRLCQSDMMFSSICESDYVWQDLIKRDFGYIYSGDNARSLYLLYKRALDFFSKYIPIITHKALSLLVTYIPPLEWDDLSKSLESFLNDMSEHKLVILDIETLHFILSPDNALYKEDYVRPLSFDKYYDIFNKVADVRVLYPDFDLIVKRLNESVGDDFIELISTPTLIFANKRLIPLQYDHDLMELIIFKADEILSNEAFYKLRKISWEINQKTIQELLGS